MTEDEIQTAIVTHFRKYYEGFIAHVPNGGRRGKLEAMRFKAMGVLPGHPDLIIYCPKGVFLMEVKEPKKGTLSDNQKKLFPRLQDLGLDLAIVWSIDEAKRAFMAWGLPRKMPGSASPELQTGF